MGIQYSDYFAAYPWMPDKNFEYLITKTLNMLGVHQVSEIRAQSSAALSREFTALSCRALTSSMFSNWITITRFAGVLIEGLDTLIVVNQ
jgi:hypothetical protein